MFAAEGPTGALAITRTQGMELCQVHAGGAHHLEHRGIAVDRAERIVDHEDAHALPRLFRKRLRESAPGFIAMEDVDFQADLLVCGADGAESRGEALAVLEELDPGCIREGDRRRRV